MPTERASTEQRQFARHLRHQLTDCERLLWSRLRNRGLARFKFRRQHPWPPYVLDFYCAELRLVVCGYLRPELDFDSFQALVDAIEGDCAAPAQDKGKSVGGPCGG